jgi:hypothetical protein
MTTTTTDAPRVTAPLLRTLSPALRGLERRLRGWLDGPHRYPLSTMTRAGLEGLADDLRRQAEALDVERPLLVIMLMGGTGVGKSTLLNALAGGAVAQASFTRPTTRDPVVYYHTGVRTDRLDASLRHCRLAAHERPALEQKILVDTPDLDSNDLANRDKLIRLLPVADIVLYVGSQEKYHDQLGWELFLEHRKRRAFAFVLNKWDRCLHAGAAGLRPDEDLLRDLKGQGFVNPLLFRTCAQLWVDRARLTEAPPTEDGAPVAVPEGPEGEQFRDLVNWLEAGLSRLEIEAIKARGVNQLLMHLEQALSDARPPDLAEVAERTKMAWDRILNEEAANTTDVLLETLEPYQREIEHHFALEGQRRFRGIMASYFGMFTKLRYLGSNLRERIPFASRSRGDKDGGADRWDLSMFTYVCTDVAANRMLDSRGKAMANRLLVEADTQGFPVGILNEPVEAVARTDWRQRYAQVLSEVLRHVERQWSHPTGTRRVVQGVLVTMADWLPLLTFIGAIGVLLYQYFVEKKTDMSFWVVLLPLAVLLCVLVLLHLLIALLLPMRWPAIREQFKKRLGERLQEELNSTYAAVPGELATALAEERKQIETVVAETKEVAGWLQEREQAASIAGLYGN